METYTHTKSSELYEKAATLIPGGIPGHLGPGEGCFIPIDAYPLYAERAEGPYFWDIDGNRYIDLMCAYGPNILGYNDPDVEAAANAQAKKLNAGVLPGTVMVDLAELLVDTIDSADWAFFAKNGGDATTYMLMVARAATGRDKVIRFNGGYHGVVGWTQALGNPGVAPADVSDVIMLDFGDIDALHRAVEQHKGQIAAIMATPYHHPVFADNVLPQHHWWQKVRALCDKEGIVLAIDDVRCGFRLDVGGSDKHYGFQADLAAYCKALANGHNISAVVGRQDLKDAAASVMYTGSYWSSAVPMAAAVACISKMREIDAAKICLEQGAKLCDGFVKIAAEHGFDFHATGETSMPYLRIAGWNGQVDDNFLLHQEWVSQMVRRGVFMTNHHNHFLNTAVSDDDIAFIHEVADEAFRIVARRAKQILGR